MTREKAIEELQAIKSEYSNRELGELRLMRSEVQALEMAIQTLSQECVEPTQKHVGNALVMRCDDAVSRQAVIKTVDAHTNEDGTLDDDISVILEDLPSVTQKSGKWDRLYSWLNDMRLGIAPDETVTDIDERNCRESQTDILDEIMEWMIKAERSE